MSCTEDFEEIPTEVKAETGLHWEQDCGCSIPQREQCTSFDIVDSLNFLAYFLNFLFCSVVFFFNVSISCHGDNIFFKNSQNIDCFG